MYVVRRIWAVEPRQARKAATLVAEIAAQYEDAGQRSSTRVYFNGGTVPGEKDRVYMEWIEESIQSPYRAGNESPQQARDLGAKLRAIAPESWIEFYELFTADKAQSD
ncbi:MAG: hypothetical protein WD152_00470 [Nitriliruptoraceae bacterium]